MPALLPLLALACTAEPVVPDTPPRRPGNPQNAIIIVIDTLRADVLSEVASPVIDGLARDGASVGRAWGAGTWTVPSVVSLFTGMSVRQHGWDLPTGKLGHYPPLPPAPRLAEVLHEQGFATSGYYTNPYLAEELGFEHGFDQWHRTVDKMMPRQFAQEVKDSWDDGRRHFAYLHLIGPHSPLRPSEDARQRHDLETDWFNGTKGFGIGSAKRGVPVGARRAYGTAYRAVVEDCDARVGELLAALGTYRSETVVVLTADHGEMLGDHNVVGHGTWVWEGLTHVPLVVDDPYIPGPAESLPETLSITSIPALVTEHLGVTHTWPTAADASLPLVAQREGLLAMSFDGHTKVVWQKGSAQVFDLSTDAAEAKPVADDGSLAAARAEWEAKVPPGALDDGHVTLATQTVEELKELGYLQ